ncbi:Glutamate decarboxylase 2 [Conoideocrella luteorostrata]|uniref:Glutamate decarboxylase 2 n=1 Tax=Conoideocrella luteorostrata TaxID=1105319 RepID=A0AAJ0CG56_9HYPO|nr:Glutamate decarboxylase 2 [Conoideocrella luteorostrata]
MKAAPAPINRADELADLLDAVKALIIPYIRKADQEAAVKPSGRLLDPRHTGGRGNVLVEPCSRQELLENHNFSLPTKEGRGKEGLLSAIQDILRYSVNTWDQGYLDKLNAATNPAGVISEVILGVLNQNVHVYHVSPVLTVVEKMTSRALASYFGYTGPNAGGFTCPGGSNSNMTSIVVARNTLYPDCKINGNKDHKFVIFTGEHGHYSVEKAAIICGMGSSSVVSVPVDDSSCMNTAALRQLVIEAKAQGQTPLYVNATAGTTVYGGFDSFREIRAICTEFNMWLHIDASWGGSVAFSSAHRHKLNGCELSDSLTINPHKMLNVPMTCSFLLTNDLSRFHRSNSLRAGYLFHVPEDNEVWDLADQTLQCGCRGDSMKMALTWIYYGAAGFERRVDSAFERAEKLATMIEKSPDFILVSSNPPPCLQVCFYYAPNGHQPASKDENTRITRAMIDRMVERGFMFDCAPGPMGHFFRVVVNCETLPGTLDGLFKGLSEVGKEVVPP